MAGRIAIALVSGTPDGDNPHGQFARYEDVRWKAIAARNAGAKALMVIARENNFNEDRLSQIRFRQHRWRRWYSGDRNLAAELPSKIAQ